MNNGGHDIQDLCLSCIGNIIPVVEKNCLKQAGNKAIVDHLQVIGLFNVCVDELEDLFLDGTETADLWHLCCNITLENTSAMIRRGTCTNHTFSLHGLVDQLAACTVHGKHVEVDAANLRVKVAADRRASRNICLHDVADDFDGLCILKYVRILVC